MLVRERPSLELAERLLQQVLERALALGVRVAAAVVDDGGAAVALIRMDDAGAATPEIALAKAATAAVLGTPTDALGASTRADGGNWGLNTVLGGRIVVLPGGIPLCRGERVVGGLGVSGATGEQDLDCARFAVAAVDELD